MKHEYHVFISHASQDKDNFVRPLTEELRRKNYSVWYDELRLKLGDNLSKEIDKAISKSMYGIVVLSPHFLHQEKRWTYYELKLLMEREKDGKKVILPIWHGGINAGNVKQYFPEFSEDLLNRLAVDSCLGIGKVVSKIIEVLELDDLSSSCGINYNQLSKLLSDKNWKEADRETYLRMLQIMNLEENQGLIDTELKNFPCTDLRTIDQLWLKYSNERFGFSVQKEIYLNVVGNLKNKNFSLETTKNLIKFADCVACVKGEKWDINWIEYNEAIFNITAPLGHFSLRIYCIWAVLWGKEVQEMLPEETRNNISWANAYFVPHIAQRLINCNIYPIVETIEEIKSPRTDYLEYRYLESALAHEQWQEADSITYSMMLEVLGLNENDEISCQDMLNFTQVVLDRIDRDWRGFSNDRFGFSIQKKIYLQVNGKLNSKYDERAFKRFAEHVGWRKGLIFKSWINGNDLIDNINAPLGHRPAIIWGFLPINGENILLSRIRDYY